MNNEMMKNSLIGLILGDALGVPVEFKSRDELVSNPVTGMVGYGTHNLPTGTWSDDSSMTLITMESLSEGNNPEDIMKGFCKWAYSGYMTPYGKAFSIGRTTSEACRHYKINKDILKCGGTSERSNGNGSLMRILPISLYYCNDSDKNIVQKSFEISSLTHAHIRSKVCCAIYSLIVRDLGAGKNLYESLANAIRIIKPYIPDTEINEFKRILNFEIVQLNKSSIKSSGYVIDTLEAALWCVFNFDNYKDAVLTAVNLGDDTDTVAAVTGGLAGLTYGLKSVSSKWINSLAKKDKIFSIIDNFISLS